MVEWVEVKGASVELAVQAALEELGIEADRAEVNVLQEPKPGFLGIGRQDAIVRVKPKSKGRRGRSGRSRQRKRKAPRKPGSDGGARPKDRGKTRGAAKAKSRQPGGKPGDSKAGRGRKQQARKGRRAEGEVKAVAGDGKDGETLGTEQAEVVREFLDGLLKEFGLEGEVETGFDGKLVRADITGEQTQALIGPKASIMHAVHELTRTIVQRKTARGCRLRLDIAGYGEKRRQALGIYAGQLAEQVLDEGGEIMLEPMNAVDRKVVHDAVSGIDGVRSYSEGTEPRRSVVISLD
ncbi:MAG: Jag N-terminal domain-containing protein [bacterium]|nr:Jag N-terminal domain-containing protein [bacterium]MDE0352873.1 Jag N-terminal domain-containing protein [bacterium]